MPDKTSLGNRYYTPTINEIIDHIIQGETLFCKVHKSEELLEIKCEGNIFELVKFLKSHCSMAYGEILDLDNNLFRVKYLDKKDIEKLGFTVTHEEVKSYGYYLKGWIYTGKNKTELWYSHLTNKKKVYITLKDSHFNGNCRAYIKSKLEFKKLLQQLNIL